MHVVFATSEAIDTSVFARKQDDLHWSSVDVLVNAALLASVLACRLTALRLVGTTG